VTDLPDLFYAAALAAYYCSTDEGWGNFTAWARREGILGDGEDMPQELMREIEVLSARLAQVLNGEG
jgi:hypothetical protein